MFSVRALGDFLLSLDHLLFSSSLSAGVDSARRGLPHLSSSLTHQRCRLRLGPDERAADSTPVYPGMLLGRRHGLNGLRPRPLTQKVAGPGPHQLHMQDVGGQESEESSASAEPRRFRGGNSALAVTQSVESRTARSFDF